MCYFRTLFKAQPTLRNQRDTVQVSHLCHVSSAMHIHRARIEMGTQDKGMEVEHFGRQAI